MASKKRPSVPPKNSSGPESWENDEILRELYEQRDRYCAKFDYDLDRIVADMNRIGAESRRERKKQNPKAR